MQKIEVPEAERIVFIPDKYGSNMSLKYGYSNIGFFSSGRNRDVLKAMYRLGYNVQMDEQLWITSYSGTFVNYSMVGVKYYISKEQLEDEIFGFELDEVFDDYYIYKNKNNLDIGFYLSENVEESYNPFKMQNDFLNSMNMDVDTHQDIYGRTDNVIQNKIDNEKDSKRYTDIENIIENKYFRTIENAKDIITCDNNLTFNETTREYTLTYKVKAIEDCSIYIASDYNLKVYINDKPIFENYSNIWSYETGIKQIKHLKQGDEFEFKIKTNQHLELLYVYVSNNKKIQEIFDYVKNKKSFDNVKFNSNGLEGIANFESGGILCFSINYDDVWKVYVDGVETKKEAVANAFLGVKLKKGKHKITIDWGRFFIKEEPSPIEEEPSPTREDPSLIVYRK